jgi:hypothetical protein
MKQFQALFASLCLCLAAMAQTSLQQQELQKTVDQFMAIYNTGDSARYYALLEPVVHDKKELTELLDRYKFTFKVIGKVDVQKIDFISPTQADVWARDRQFDSWWKFSVLTDSLQHFQKRLVKPDRFSAAFIKRGALTSKQIAAEVDDYIKNKLGDQFSGNVLITHNDQVVLSKSYGNNNEGKPNTMEQDFGLASMGKMFTAITILQLQDKKLLSLDDTVGKFLPGLKNKALTHITLKQLLTHSSGMGDFFESPLYNKIKDSIKTAADMLPVIEEEKLAFEPGKGWQYSNTGFSLLGILIEKITGTSFEDYVRKNVFAPAGMRHSTVGSGAGGGRSTVQDLSHFSKALLGGQLLSKEATHQILSYTINDQYGLGTEHYRLGDEHIVGHSGGFIKECTELNLYTHSQYTVIILSNSNPPFGHFISDKIKELVVRKS